MIDACPFSKEQPIAERYKLCEFIGAGATGWVLKVEDLALNNEVLALKVLYPHLIENNDALNRFRAEVLITHKLLHRNIVRTFSFSSDNQQTHFISMEYVDGSDLRTHLCQTGFSTDYCIRYLASIAQAMRHATSRGVVHRDLKPDNILLTNSGELKVADFGISQFASAAEEGAKGRAAVGTPKYMSPEQFRGEALDERSDIYSFGIIAYELACGKVPFDGNTMFVLAQQHSDEPLPKLTKGGGQHPQWFEEFVETCVEKDRKNRFQSFDEICACLSSHVPIAESCEDDAVDEPAIVSRPSLERIELQWTHLPAEQRGTAKLLSSIWFYGIITATVMIPFLPESISPVGPTIVALALLGFMINLRLTLKFRRVFFPLLILLILVAVARANPASWRRVATLIFKVELYTETDLWPIRKVFDLDFTPLETETIFDAMIRRQNRGKEIIRSLEDSGVELGKLRNHQGKTLLNIAASHDKSVIMSMLLTAGVPIDSVDSRGRTALHLLTSNRDTEFERLVPIHFGADPNIIDFDGLTPLYNAWMYGKINSVNQLLSRGARPDILNLHGKTSVLHEVAQSGSAEILKRVLLKTSNVNLQNNDGQTALHLLSIQDSSAPQRSEKIALLLKHGVEVSLKDNYGKTAIDYVSLQDTNAQQMLKAAQGKVNPALPTS